MTNEYSVLSGFNRSEAPSSVALALVLAEPGLGRDLLNSLSNSLNWTMWSLSDADASQKTLSLSEGQLQASALFFPFRDMASPDPTTSEEPWLGELDVVALIPGQLVIGFELKVLSTTSGLAKQMEKQIAGLRMIAGYYDCPHVAQVALAPAFPPSLPQGVNQLSFLQLREAIDKIGTPDDQDRGVLTILRRQIDHVLKLTKLPENLTIRNVTLDELRSMRDNGTGDYSWVGVIEGIEKLKLSSRLRWKVAKEKLGDNWYPIAKVVDRIEQLSSTGLAPEQKKNALGIVYLRLEELLALGRDPTGTSKWVGATEGIEDLRISTRAKWQVTDTKRNKSWHPLKEVVTRIEELLKFNAP